MEKVLQGGKWTIWAFRRLLLTLGAVSGLLCALILRGNVLAALAPPPETVPAVATLAPTVPKSTLRPTNLWLPYPISETSVVAYRMAVYEGPFMEDGTYREVTKCAALLVRNDSDRVVETGEVILERGGLLLRFPFTMLPPGGLVMVLEREGKYCPERDFSACYGWGELLLEEPLAAQTLEITPQGMGSIAVTNRAKGRIGPTALFYKSYDKESGIYIGGKTYRVEIPALAPGETVTVYPEHYADGYSRIFLILPRS